MQASGDTDGISREDFAVHFNQIYTTNTYYTCTPNPEGGEDQTESAALYCKTAKGDIKVFYLRVRV